MASLMVSGFEPRRIPPSEVSRLIEKEVPVEEPRTIPSEMIGSRKGMRVIKGVCLCVMMLSAMTSGYFLYAWNRGMRGIFLSLSISVSITSCQILLPELSIFLVLKRKLTPILGSILLMILAMVATVFSMGATIGGLYDSRSVTLRAGQGQAQAQASAIEAQLSAAREKKTVLQNQLSWAQKEAADYSTQVGNLLDQSLPVDAMERKRNSAQARIAGIMVQLEDVNGKIVALSGNALSTVTVRDDFYSWTGKRIGATAETVEFVMSAFPAVFNEIVAPTMLAVVLFL